MSETTDININARASMDSGVCSSTGSIDDTDPDGTQLQSDINVVNNFIIDPPCSFSSLNSAAMEEISEPNYCELTSASSFKVIYLGNMLLDRRYTQAMLPWIMAEIRRKGEKHHIILEIIGCYLKATIEEQKKVAFEHKLNGIFRFARTSHDYRCFCYHTRETLDSPFVCHVFEAEDECVVLGLFKAVREATKEVVSLNPREFHSQLSCSKLEEIVENEDDFQSCQYFEVMYLGRIKCTKKKTPPTFIDDAVEKFHLLELEKLRAKQEAETRQRHGSGISVKSLPGILEGNVTIRENDLARQSERMNNGSDYSSSDNILNNQNTCSENRTSNENSSNEHIRKDSGSQDLPRTKSSQNRTLLVQIGKTELNLISPDKKTVLHEKKYKDISFCTQGINQPDHFGFICRETSSDKYLCYIFKCQSEIVVNDIMQALKQAFHSAFNRTTKNHVVCELCPMHQLHKLCVEIEGVPASKAHSTIWRKIEMLSEEEQADFRNKLRAANITTVQDQNEILIAALKEMCEAKQKNHSHISDSNQNSRNEINLMDRRGSRFDNLKKKAKKSLSSFETLMKRKSSKEDLPQLPAFFRERSATTDSENSIKDFSDGDMSPCPTPTKKEFGYDFDAFPHSPTQHLPPVRPRSSTVGEVVSESERRAIFNSKVAVAEKKHSPMMNIFIKVGNSPKSQYSSSNGYQTPKQKSSGWRQAIFNRVVTPVQVMDTSSISDLSEKNKDSPASSSHSQSGRRSPASLRALWRKAIMEQILLIRMEKENRNLKGYFVIHGTYSLVIFPARQEAVTTKRLKLDYEEITPCLKEVTKVWDEMLNTPDREQIKFDPQKLLDAVKAGMPRHKRGEIWQLLMEQHRLLHSTSCSGDTDVPYEELLLHLTSHQHAILIDLGRTFPSYKYFSKSLGAGQLSLFNLLKAYSMLDKEVGYCQGLSFVAGILLLHMSEEKAFEMLRYMMFQLGFRQQYKPDMVALQIQMYQLSRLLHDECRELSEHFNKHDIGPTLYAAPWFLTLFASQFPLGFVARVFDLIFLQGLDVIFKVALVLLINHKELILQFDVFEDVVEFLKTTLPSMGIIQMERVINQVFKMNISKQLHTYEVEYHLFQEEMFNSSQQSNCETIQKLDIMNQNLKKENKELMEQLQIAQSNYDSLEAAFTNSQTSISTLESRIRTLELERTSLLTTLDKYRKHLPAIDVDFLDLDLSSSGCYSVSSSMSTVHPGSTVLEEIDQEISSLGHTNSSTKLRYCSGDSFQSYNPIAEQ